MNCPACGSDIHEDDKFCNECGASLTVSVPDGTHMKCPVCGFTLPPIPVSFCQECGSRLETQKRPEIVAGQATSKTATATQRYDNDLLVADMVRLLTSGSGEGHHYFHLKKHIAKKLVEGVKQVVMMGFFTGLVEGITGRSIHPDESANIDELIIETREHLEGAVTLINSVFINSFNHDNATDYEFERLRPSNLDQLASMAYQMSFSSGVAKRKPRLLKLFQKRLVVECVEFNWATDVPSKEYLSFLTRGLSEGIPELESKAISGVPCSKQLLIDCRNSMSLTRDDAQVIKRNFVAERKSLEEMLSSPFITKKELANMSRMGIPTRLWFKEIWMLYLDRAETSPNCIRLLDT